MSKFRTIQDTQTHCIDLTHVRVCRNNRMQSITPMNVTNVKGKPLCCFQLQISEEVDLFLVICNRKLIRSQNQIANRKVPAISGVLLFYILANYEQHDTKFTKRMRNKLNYKIVFKDIRMQSSILDNHNSRYTRRSKLCCGRKFRPNIFYFFLHSTLLIMCVNRFTLTESKIIYR